MPSSTSSATAQMSGMPSKILGMSIASKPVINIHLDEPRAVYTTLDKISGKIIITVPHDTKFETINISFRGKSKTYIEKLNASPGLIYTPSALHNFLCLTQPMPESVYPQQKILKAGQTYEYPFIFVVPQRLLPRVCRHATDHESIHDLHLQLPPTIDSAKGGDEGWLKQMDDIAPPSARITYNIFAIVQDAGKNVLANESRSVRILPKVAEQPPVNVDGPDSDYQLRKEKIIKKGLFKGPLGGLVVEAKQPKSFRIPSEKPELRAGISTAVKVKLRFDPADANVAPPKLGRLCSRMKVNTWFADTARSMIPDKSCVQFDCHQGVLSEMISLNTRPMESVEWKFQKDRQAPPLVRQDSGISGCFTHDDKAPSPSGQYKGKGFYTAEIFVPITLPGKKYLVPTFHSCIISRTYALYLDLRIQGSTVAAPAVQLKVPVQISAGDDDGTDSACSTYASSVEEELDETLFVQEFFAPRTITPMEASLVGNSRLSGMPSASHSEQPPKYEMFGRVRDFFPHPSPTATS